MEKSWCPCKIMGWRKVADEVFTIIWMLCLYSLEREENDKKETDKKMKEEGKVSIKDRLPRKT